MARVGDSRGAYTVSVGRTEGNRTLGRTRCRCKGNIKKDLKEMAYGLFDLAHDRDNWWALVSAVMNHRVP